MGRIWTKFRYRSANKVFWQTIRGLLNKQTPIPTFIKDANSVLLKHQKDIPNRWREYFRELLNLVVIQLSETSEEQINEEIYQAEAKVNTAIKSLKAAKAPGKKIFDPKC